VRPIARLTGRKHSLSFGGSGTFDVGPFWSRESAEEKIDHTFDAYVEHALKSNAVVFACVLARQSVFAEARFQFQRLTGGRPGELFGDPSLGLLERPWQGAVTGDLLARLEQYASAAGNWYGTVVDDSSGRRVRQLRPDRVTIVTGSRSGNPLALDARVVGYMYDPGNGSDPVLLTPDKVAHYAPIPDPAAQWRGMSWMTPVINEIKGDKAATRHKQKFFENGAMPSMVITYDPAVSKDAFSFFVEKFREQHTGVDNAYKVLHLGGGADPKTMGSNLQQLDFKAVQGAGETRIAAAAGVGAVIAQLSEGLQGSSLNAGNFNAARRRFADGTIRPLWRSAAGSLEMLVPPPSGSRLWYDARDIAFLQDDQKDEAEVQAKHASTIASLISAGFEPDSVIAAVTSGDLRSLSGSHSGLYSVQLQPIVEAQGELSLDSVESVGRLIRAGFEPGAALAALGLPPIDHTGLEPVTLREDTE
jgi:phage portal protein BeeE